MVIGLASARSQAGSGRPTAAFEASRIRKYWPGARVTAGSSVSWVVAAPKLPVPVALAYWTELPASEAGAVPRL